MFKSLSQSGILGMNKRIGKYILRENPRRSYPLVDSKILTAKCAVQNNLPMPEHYAEISHNGDLKHLHSLIGGLSKFVVKPANGAMGNGLLVVESSRWDSPREAEFVTTRQKTMELKDFRYYLSGILSGLYSLNGLPDQIIIQRKLEMHPFFQGISYRGIPDFRIIVFRGYPIMAMVRLPTSLSAGRANLHQGAVGVGVRIADGLLTSAVCNNRSLEVHPDTGETLKGRTVPFWQDILLLASKCYDAVGMGCLGVDVVLDPEKGPQLLEMNARPGLSIQIANGAGLVPRLELAATWDPKLCAADKVRHAVKELSFSL